MAATLSSAANSLSSLLGRSGIDDHEEILRAADTTLGKSGSDLEARHVKVVALLKLDRFEDALKVLDNGGDKLKEKARLEWAYALYKSGNPAKAAEVARQGTERGIKHVEAQASYRVEDFRRAAELYTTLASEKGQVANEDVDLRINGGAVDALLEWANLGQLVKSKKPTRQDLEAFETAYNAACASIARDELGQAEILLKRSKDLCSALEDLSEDDKQAELLPITVQQVYVLTRLGRQEEAEKLASGINPSELSDSSSKHVAQVNSIASSVELANPYITERLIHIAPETIRPDRLFAYQSNVLRRNNFAIGLLAQKFSGTADSTMTYIKSKSAPTLDPTVNSLAVINAAAHARNQTGREALKTILPELEKRPNDVGLVLVIAQLYVLTGNHDAATRLLETFLDRLSQSSKPEDLDVRYAPGLVGTLVSLYSARNQSSHIRKELSKAASYWRQKPKDSFTRSITHLLKTAGTALLDSADDHDQELAAQIFTDLSSSDPEDRYTSAGLIAAQSLTSPSSITPSQLATLTPVPRLITSIDASALEAAGVAKPTPTTSTTTTTPSLKRPAPSSSKKTATANKKPKPSRMPKNYDPDKQPDPERWLPLKDRSSYRPKGGKKAKARQAMLTQGGPVSEESSRPGTPGGGGASAGVVGGGGAGAKGKSGGKKKGGKK